MSNTKVLVWTLAGVMTPELSAALAQATGCEGVQPLKEATAQAEPAAGKAQRLKQLTQRLTELAAQPVVVVHDVTSADLDTNLELAQTATTLGFRPLFVYWRHDARRMMARAAAGKALAKQGVPALVHRSRRGVESLAALLHHAGQAGWSSFGLALEDLQGPADAAAPQRQQQLLAWLQASSGDAGLAAAFERARQSLPADAQPAADDERLTLLWQELAWTPGVEARYTWLRPRLSVAEPAPASVAALRVAPPPPYAYAGQEFGLTGALRLQAEAQAQKGWSLKLLAGEDTYLVDWAPAAAADKPARFDSGVLPVHGGLSMRLVLVSPQGEETTLATLEWEGPARQPVSGVLAGVQSLGYVAVPKVACTSMKQALFRLGTGVDFQSDDVGTHVHRYFADHSGDVTLADFKFLIVRDPVKRFLSAYANRVVHHRELSRKFITARAQRLRLDLDDFVFDPDLDTFLDRFTTYCKVGPILHHTRPVAHFVPDLGVFDKVYPIESMQELQADISRRIGRDFEVGRSQTGGPKIGIDELSLAQLERLFELYRDDYALLKDFYTPQKLLAEREALLAAKEAQA